MTILHRRKIGKKKWFGYVVQLGKDSRTRKTMEAYDLREEEPEEDKENLYGWQRGDSKEKMGQEGLN
jgi:hypothetical protein